MPLRIDQYPANTTKIVFIKTTVTALFALDESGDIYSCGRPVYQVLGYKFVASVGDFQRISVPEPLSSFSAAYYQVIVLGNASPVVHQVRPATLHSIPTTSKRIIIHGWRFGRVASTLNVTLSCTSDSPVQTNATVSPLVRSLFLLCLFPYNLSHCSQTEENS